MIPAPIPTDDELRLQALREMLILDIPPEERLHDNPLVTGALHIRFYAGAPLQLPGGEIIGTLCMIDRRPRTLDASSRPRPSSRRPRSMRCRWTRKPPHSS